MISIVAADSAGLRAKIEPSSLTVKLVAATLPNAGKLGMWALAIFLAINLIPQPIHLDRPSFERDVMEVTGPSTSPGDLVIVTHPERVPLIRHYLGPNYRQPIR